MSDEIDSSKFGFGYIPDLPDFRDYEYKVTAPLQVPPSVDLRKTGVDTKFPIYDQGSLGSCTGNCIASAVGTLDIKQDIAANRFDPTKLFIPSRLFIYYNERAMEGSVSRDAGAYIRDGIKSVNKQGVCSETTWKYTISRFKTKPPATAYSEALKHQSITYMRISTGDTNAMKAALAEGYPVVFGFTVYDSFMTSAVARTGNVPMPKKTERVRGGHAVMAVGYDDAKQIFIVRNSWGTRWGDKGYFYMPYSYLSNPNLCADFWVIKKVEDE